MIFFFISFEALSSIAEEVKQSTALQTGVNDTMSLAAQEAKVSRKQRRKRLQTFPLKNDSFSVQTIYLISVCINFSICLYCVLL